MSDVVWAARWPARLAVAAVVLVAAGAANQRPAAAAPLATSGPLGVDVSAWQHVGGPVEWPAVRATGGQSFILEKATEGAALVDPGFADDYPQTRANGLLRGTYHYARPCLPLTTAVAQADFYVSVIGDVAAAGDLPPALDLEETGGLAPADLGRWTQTFLSEVELRTGRRPMLYTYPYFWRHAMADSHAFSEYPLWVADYTAGVAAPANPLFGGWSTWTFWQWTSTARLAGIRTIVDADRFNGTATDLTAFADGSHARPVVLPSPATSAMVPAALVATTRATVVSSGATASLVATLASNGGTIALAGQPIAVYAKATGDTDFRLIGAATTSALGSLIVQVHPSRTTRYSLRFPGTSSLSPARADVALVAKVSVTTALSRLRVRAGDHVTLRGQVSLAAAGMVAFRQRWYAHAWHTGPGARVARNGRYSFAVVPTQRGLTRMRVLFASHPGLVGSYSATVELTVR